MSTGAELAVVDRFAAARLVAGAVLYEGYLLYPYHASSRKNQMRWQFGVLVPAGYLEVDPCERSAARTECLLYARESPRLHVRASFLQVQERRVEERRGDGSFAEVEALDVGDVRHVAFDEALERTLDLAAIDLSPLLDAAAPVAGLAAEEAFAFEAGTETEDIEASGGAGPEHLGRLVRRRGRTECRLWVSVRPTGVTGEDGALLKVAVSIENLTSFDPELAGARRSDAIPASLVAAHTMLAVDGGSFVSLLDPPAEAAAAAGGCRSEGTYPVLVGSGDVVLSSPIILGDYPEVAPESPGDLYDATEIDEILALRVLTLTEAEKREARGTDARAAAVVDRCDDMAPEIWARLHGAVRSLGAVRSPGPSAPQAEVPWWDPGLDASVDPWSDTLVVAGVELSKGSPVRLQPSHRADAQDLFLRGREAVVAGIFEDVEGNPHVAVSLDDDPAAEELSWQGRYLFFHPDEIEPIAAPEAVPEVERAAPAARLAVPERSPQ